MVDNCWKGGYRAWTKEEEKTLIIFWVDRYTSKKPYNYNDCKIVLLVIYQINYNYLLFIYDSNIITPNL